MDLERNDVIKTAQAFLGEFESEIMSSENKTNISELASRIGVITIGDHEDAEDQFPMEIGGRAYIKITDGSEFDKALSVGAYLLYNEDLENLSQSKLDKCLLFAVTTQFPEIDEYDENATIGELVALSIRVNVPFAALKAAFN